MWDGANWWIQYFSMKNARKTSKISFKVILKENWKIKTSRIICKYLAAADFCVKPKLKIRCLFSTISQQQQPGKNSWRCMFTSSPCSFCQNAPEHDTQHQVFITELFSSRRCFFFFCSWCVKQGSHRASQLVWSGSIICCFILQYMMI